MKPGNIKRKAFTLVEILIVICVISILFVVLISRVDFATDKSRQAGVQNDFHAMQSALHVIALENNSFTSDITSLATELNKNLDSELSVRVENGIIKTNALDPWGSEYVLEYDKPADTNGRVTLLSPGPDTTLRTQDDIKSEVVIKVDNGKTNIVIDNNPQEEIGGGEHTCLFNRMVKESQYIKTQGNCITPTVYYYSCSCGAVGTSTFHGSLALDEHIGTPRIEYQAFDANHNVLSYCSSCNVLISTVPEAHNMVNEECTLCHKVIHNHNYNLELVSEAAKASSATCTAKATYYYSCQCGALSTDTFEYGEVRAHTFTGNSTQYKASDATCSVRATYYKTCSVCGIQGTETFESGLADGPHPGTTVPTYVKLNETQHTKKNICTACSNEVSSTTENHAFNENNTCALCDEHVHNYTVKHVDNKHIATPASCTAAAKYYYSCTCDENGTTTFNDGTPLSHNEFAEIAEDRYFKSAATCLVPTTYYKSCTGCGLKGTSTFTIGQALGHIEVQTQGYAATCTTTGLTDGITCSRCNEIVKMQMIINALGHEEVITKGKEATCTTSGVTDKVTCSRCNTIITNSTTIPALGHDIVYDEGYAATCSMPGLTTGERCSRCDYKVTQQEIAKLPHTEVVDNAVSVTCTTNGYTEGKHCSVCGEVTVPQETIPATGHAEVKLNAIAATCTSSGLTEGSQCSKCGSVLKAQTSIAAKGHTVVQDSAIAATCTNEGRTAGSHCSVCSAIISGTSTIAKLDHDYDIEITNPQCVVPGSITYTCKSCSHTYSDPLDAMGHIDTDNNSVCDICNTNLDKKVISIIDLTNSIDRIIIETEANTWGELNLNDYIVEDNIHLSIYYAHDLAPIQLHISPYLDWGYARPTIYGDREGYTTCLISDKIIDKHTYYISVTNQLYNISGKWIFNDTIRPVTTTGNTEQATITFTNNGTTYNDIEFYIIHEYNSDGTLTTGMGGSSGTKIGKAFIRFDGMDACNISYTNNVFTGSAGAVWIDENITSEIDFGIQPQAVSEKFYNWFVSNAHPVTDNTYTLSGKWKFNDNISLFIESNENVKQQINFISNNLYCYGISNLLQGSENSWLNYISDNTVAVYNDATAWQDNNYKTIDFGLTEQVVSKEFYEWFTANATQYNNPWVDDDPDETDPELSGKWQFNDTLTKTGWASDVTKHEYINFTVSYHNNDGSLYEAEKSFMTFGIRSGSGRICSYFAMHNDAGSNGHTYAQYHYDGSNCEIISSGITANTWWDNISNPVVDFGTNAQTVSQEFYEWFTANATPYEEPRYVLSGKWDFNDTLTQTGWASGDTSKYQLINFDVIVGDNILNRNVFEYGVRDLYGCVYFAMHFNGETSGHLHSQYHWSSKSYGGCSATTQSGWHASWSEFIVDFGTEPQSVSKDFYEWFIANATPYEKPTYVLSGKWQFNETITSLPDMNQNVVFTSGDMEFVTMRFMFAYNDPLCGQCYYLKWDTATNTDRPKVWASDSGWSVQNPTIDFGNTPQSVSKEFYEWFTANATPHDQNDDNTTCNHDKTITILKESTCSEMGLQLIVCSTCKTTQYKTIEKKDHSIETIAMVEATCITPGTSEGQQCSVCKEYMVRPSNIAALGHDLKTQSTTNATCLADGLSIDKCNRCGEIFNTTIKATGHIDNIKNGVCDVCGQTIEYTMHIDNVEYKFTYNMTWGEWFASKYNTTDLIQIGNSFIKISKDGKSGYKLSATKAIMNGNGLSIEVYTPQASDLVEELKYQLAKLSFAKTTLVIVTDDGVFSTEYDKLGITTYMDAANKLKDGSAYAVIYNEKVFYSYDDAVADVTVKMYVNGYHYDTLSKTYCLIDGNKELNFTNSKDPKWYIADANGDPIISSLIQSSKYIVTDDVDLIFMSTFTPELTFYDNVINQPLKNAEVLLYDKTTGQLVNKFKTNSNGVAVISGLKPGTYICKSKYESFEISLTTDNWSYTRLSQRYNFALTSTASGKLYVYDTNNNLINYVQDNNKEYNLSVFVGQYYIRLNDQEQMQILTIDENGKITLSTLQ